MCESENNTKKAKNLKATLKYNTYNKINKITNIKNFFF